MVSSKAHVLWAALWFLTWCKPTCLGNRGGEGSNLDLETATTSQTLQDLFRSPRKERSFPDSSRLFPCCKLWSIKVSERQSCGSLLCWHWNGLGSWAMKLSGAQHATVATFSKNPRLHRTWWRLCRHSLLWQRWLYTSQASTRLQKEQRKGVSLWTICAGRWEEFSPCVWVIVNLSLKQHR